MGLVFEWDPTKAEADVRKHRVRFEEAATVFADPLSLTIDDPLHSKVKHRFVTMGSSLMGRLLVVVHSDRGGRIRIISRNATRREKKAYEESEGKQT